jgi:hypothetical protein
MIYHFELFDSGGIGRRRSLDNVTSAHASLAEAVDEAKSMMSRLTFLRGKSDICVIKDQNDNIISEIRVHAERF